MSDWLALDVSDLTGDDGGAGSTSIATPGGANSKGAWTTLVASTPFDVMGLLLQWSGSNNIAYLFDVGIGAGGSEKVLVPNVYIDIRNSSTNCSRQHLFIPCFVPAGTRIAARYQGSATTGIHQLKLTMLSAGFADVGTPGSWKDYGTDLTNSRGTAVTAGNGTKGSWAQIDAAIGEDTRWVVVCANSETASLLGYSVDIGVGVAASEKIIIPDLEWTNENGNSVLVCLPCTIPAGTRVSARAQASGAGQTVFVEVIGGS